MDLQRRGFYGIRVIKTFAAFYIVYNHSASWIMMNRGEEWGLDLGSFLGFLFLLGGFQALVLPAAAGAVLRMSLQRYVVGDVIANIPLRKIALYASILALVDAIKSALTWGMNYFFWVGPLQFVAVSLLLIIWTMKYSIRWTLFLGLACLLGAKWIHEWALSLQITQASQVTALAQTNFLQYSLWAGGFVVLAIVLGFVWTSKKQGAWRFWVTALGALIYLAWALWVPDYHPENPQFAANMYNLPTALIGGSKLRFHTWPLFPWFSLVVAGFAIYHYRLKATNLKKVNRWIAWGSVSLFLIFILFFREQYIGRVGHSVLWTERLFNPGIPIVLGVMAFFGLESLFFGWIDEWLDRSPRVFVQRVLRPFAINTSESLLWIYLLSTSFGYFIAISDFARNLPTLWALLLVPHLTDLLTFPMAYAVIRILNRKTFHITLRQKTGIRVKG